MSENQPIGYNGKIGIWIQEQIRAGVSVKDIFEGCKSNFGTDAPRSYVTFYKYYREDMAAARGEIVKQIGDKVVQQALEGDYKSQELYLRSKGGWSPNQTVNEAEGTPEDREDKESAVEVLARMLGKDVG